MIGQSKEDQIEASLMRLDYLLQKQPDKRQQLQQELEQQLLFQQEQDQIRKQREYERQQQEQYQNQKNRNVSPQEIPFPSYLINQNTTTLEKTMYQEDQQRNNNENTLPLESEIYNMHINKQQKQNTIYHNSENAQIENQLQQKHNSYDYQISNQDSNKKQFDITQGTQNQLIQLLNQNPQLLQQLGYMKKDDEEDISKLVSDNVTIPSQQPQQQSTVSDREFKISKKKVIKRDSRVDTTDLSVKPSYAQVAAMKKRGTSKQKEEIEEQIEGDEEQQEGKIKMDGNLKHLLFDD